MSYNSARVIQKPQFHQRNYCIFFQFRRSFKPSYAYMESPFNDRVVGPISDYNVPDEYIHHLPFKGTLPDPFENMSKMATDLVRVLELGDL